jgi:asparagine synthase (glutamine-hydrolysing)
VSGICGLYRFEGRPVTHKEIHHMNNAMKLLGPDGSDVWRVNSVGLAYQAFHLTYESIHEILPYYDQRSNITITADCRLDNRETLCKHFNLKDEPSLSDSFLILMAYQKWSKDCPKHLLGEFAVVLWDATLQELICFVDHTGCRTFYYYHDTNLFAFATDVHALHTLNDINRKPNLKRIAADGNTGYLLNQPHITSYESILKVPARTLLTIKNKQLQRHVYWQPDIYARINFNSEDEYVHAFQDLFRTVIRDKLRSHYPVMTLHSGGLDSSSITAMTASILRCEGKHLTSLSAMLPQGYQGQTTDESYYINLLKNPNLTIQSVTDLWRGPFDGLNDERYCMDWGNKSSRYYLYKAFATAASSHGARIIFDGCFGEKGPSFHGNGYFAELLVNLHWKTFFNEILLHNKSYNKPFIKAAIKEGLFPLLPALLQAKLNLRSSIGFSKELSFIKQSFIDTHVCEKTFEKERLHLNTQYPNHRHHQYQSINYLPAHNSFMHDDKERPIHFCYPFKDKRMLEFCLAIPGNLKVKHGYKRYSIRAGMRGLMPDELRFRTTKEPFSPDYHDRFNRQLVKAREFVVNAPKTPLMQEIIDISRLESELKYTMDTNRCSTKRDFTAMHTIPSAIYLMAFLCTF